MPIHLDPWVSSSSVIAALKLYSQVEDKPKDNRKLDDLIMGAFWNVFCRDKSCSLDLNAENFLCATIPEMRVITM